MRGLLLLSACLSLYLRFVEEVRQTFGEFLGKIILAAKVQVKTQPFCVEPMLCLLNSATDEVGLIFDLQILKKWEAWQVLLSGGLIFQSAR